MRVKREHDATACSRGTPEGDEPRQKGRLFGSTTEAIRQLIINGVLAAGQRVRERELCEQLDVSRTPVREAIKTLTQEGLLRSLPNRSAIVADMDLEEIRSLSVVAATIESLAAELACATLTEDDIEAIAAAHHEMSVWHVQNEFREYFRFNKAFHRTIVRATRNGVLLSIWDLLSTRVDRARYASNLQPKRWPNAIKEHAEILEALIARDATRASSLMDVHVRNGLSGVIAALEAEAQARQQRPADTAESASSL